MTKCRRALYHNSKALSFYYCILNFLDLKSLFFKLEILYNIKLTFSNATLNYQINHFNNSALIVCVHAIFKRLSKHNYLKICIFRTKCRLTLITCLHCTIITIPMELHCVRHYKYSWYNLNYHVYEITLPFIWGMQVSLESCVCWESWFNILTLHSAIMAILTYQFNEIV